jgi:hypothetical protein
MRPVARRMPKSNEGLTMGVVDRSAAGHTGAMINLKNLLAHKLDAPFGACSPPVPAPLPCQPPVRPLDDTDRNARNPTL